MPATKSIAYPGFEYRADELSAYTVTIGIFIISLKNGNTTRFEPDDIAAFEQWMEKHKIRDIRKDDGIPRNYRS